MPESIQKTALIVLLAAACLALVPATATAADDVPKFLQPEHHELSFGGGLFTGAVLRGFIEGRLDCLDDVESRCAPAKSSSVPYVRMQKVTPSIGAYVFANMPLQTRIGLRLEWTPFITTTEDRLFGGRGTEQIGSTLAVGASVERIFALGIPWALVAGVDAHARVRFRPGHPPVLDAIEHKCAEFRELGGTCTADEGPYLGVGGGFRFGVLYDLSWGRLRGDVFLTATAMLGSESWKMRSQDGDRIELERDPGLWARSGISIGLEI